MSRFLKKMVIAMAVLLALLVLVFAYSVYADQRRLAAATNPCERDCLLDSGGVDDCRKECASHPLTYGPAVPASSR